MKAPPLHRKLVKHFEHPNQARAVTFSCHRRLPLLRDDQRCGILAEAIERACARHGYALHAFVFMPEHVHALLTPCEGASSLDKWLYAVKRPSSYRMKETMNERQVAYLTVAERPGTTTFRFWQEGPGYDRNLWSADKIREFVDYVHENPVKRHLCAAAEEWRWSSWRVYHRPGEVPADFKPRVTHWTTG